RQAVREVGDGWISLIVCPAILLPGENQPAIAQMLTSRESQWFGRFGNINPHGKSEFEIELSGEAPNPYRTRAFIKANYDGQALLAIFHAKAKDLTQIDAAWNQMTSTLHFDPQKAPRQLYQNGVTLVKAVKQSA